MRAERPALIVALHGCRQDAEDFAAGTRLDEVGERYGAVVLYPEQDLRANGHRCWNWFLPENQHRTGPEPGAILEVVAEVSREHALESADVILLGLSSGGSLAAILAEQCPDIFHGVGIMAGVPLHVASDEAGAYAAMRGEVTPSRLSLARLPARESGRFRNSRAIVWTGREDQRVAPRNAELLAMQFRGLFGLHQYPAQEEVVDDGRIVRWRDYWGKPRVELREIDGVGHAWSGGSLRGSFTAPDRPDASTEMVRFLIGESR
ncbi:MAG: PHB depolymerase family esterase [Candidatus Eremiobacteraeota bacterium]|nr:PHB depolymerase family esterase [Candidatus Eremiobacteraeota bacterium]MBV8355887.1 PHB depolymerase family esterase [Candidatus Eremiobacteraeota bacterium]